MKELPKVYDPKSVEKKVYEMWMDGHYFEGKIDPDKKPFSIVMQIGRASCRERV